MSQKAQRDRTPQRIEVDWNAFYQAAVLDTMKHCPDVASLLADIPNPPVFRSHLEDLLLETESSFVEGGASRYIALRQLSALVEKNPHWGSTDKDTAFAAGVQKFLKCEDAMRRANKRIKWFREHPSRYPVVHGVMEGAALLIQEILGEFDYLTLQEVYDKAHHGSGATLRHPRKTCTLYDKIVGGHAVSQRGKALLVDYLMGSPELREELKGLTIETCDDDELFGVPKKWDIERIAAKGASWNIFFQLGVGEVIAARLLPYGIDLSDQDRGKPLARAGSNGGNSVTVDFSSASDLVATEAVRWLMLESWFDVLDQIRHHTYKLPSGEVRSYSKFSAMGNGFTFPLESLIFYAIASTCCDLCGLSRKQVRVYGDDVVIPREAYLLFVEVTRFLGMKVNVQKTYAFGYFRETCGSDFLQGVDVRPVYFSGELAVETDVYSLVNRLRTGAMFEMNTLTKYLTKLVRQPVYGPWYFGAGPASLKDLCKTPDQLHRFSVKDRMLTLPVWEFRDIKRRLKRRWSAGESVLIDGYFITDHPRGRKTYNADYQASAWDIRVFRRTTRPRKGAFQEWAQYRAFLLGLEAGIPSTHKPQLRLQTMSIVDWPDLRHVAQWQVSERTSSSW